MIWHKLCGRVAQMFTAACLRLANHPLSRTGKAGFAVAVGLAVLVAFSACKRRPLDGGGSGSEAASPEEAPPPPPSPVQPDTVTGAPGPVPLLGRSRYAGSPILEHLLAIEDPPRSAVVATTQRFRWGDLGRYGENAFAMAASRTGVRVNADRIHSAACDGNAETCEMADYDRVNEPDVTILRSVVGSPTESGPRLPSSDTIATMVAKIAASWELGQGVVIPLFSPDGFPDRENELVHMHLFVLQAMDKDGTLYVRDTADHAPVTYRVRLRENPAGIVVPLDASLRGSADVGRQWGTAFFTVGGLPSKEPTPAPPPVPEGSASPGACPGAFCLPTVRIPESAAARWLTLRELGNPNSLAYWFFGQDVQQATATSSWLTERASEHGCYPVPGGLRCTRPKACGDIWNCLYGHVPPAERDGIVQIAAAIAKAGGDNRRWKLHAAARFVQSSRYEIPKENVFELRSPALTMAMREGDCDSLALLLALTLNQLGMKAVVLTSPVANHAIVGVAGGDGPSYIQAGGEQWTPIECTDQWPVGELPRDLDRPEIARSWQAHPTGFD